MAAGVLERFGITLDRVRARIPEAILNRQPSPRALTAPGATQFAAKSTVVTCCIDSSDLDALDALVEAGVRGTRGDAAAWLIHAGIEVNKALLDTVRSTVAEIRRLREVAQSLAQQVTAATTTPMPAPPESKG